MTVIMVGVGINRLKTNNNQNRGKSYYSVIEKISGQKKNVYSFERINSRRATS